MSDVTCKAVHTFLDVVAENGVDPAQLAALTPYSLHYLRDKNNRITWAEFVAIGRSMRQLCGLSDSDLEEVGTRAFKRGPLRVVMSLGRVLGEPAKFYKWMQRGNSMLFANMSSTVEERGENHVRIKIRLRDSDELSSEYLCVSKGAIASMPTLLGYPEAHVSLQTRGAQATFDVVMQPKRRSFARRAFQAFRGNQEAADELLTTNEALTRRLTELSNAHDQIKTQALLLDQQAARLRLANEVAALIHGAHDAHVAVDRITDTLLSNTQAIGVFLELTSLRDVRSRRGRETAHKTSSTITARGTPVATLTLYSRDAAECEALEGNLEYVIPVVGMALDNAVAYRELAEYQTDLERLVDERTRELTKARDVLTTTVDELRIAQESRERFFGNISHEIRTPLTLILLAAGDVQRRLEHVLDVRSREGLVSITDSARKLVRLVDELLLLAAGQADKLNLAVETTELAKLVRQVGAAWRPAAEHAGLDLLVRAVEATEASVDPVAIERVLSNLVSNAVKYTPRGGTIELELALEEAFEEGMAVRVSVFDTGSGIDGDLAQRLFGRFERGGTAERSVAGTGIGLALVKQLVEAHGGSVEARPRSPRGTEFRVVLPRVATLQAHTEPQTEQVTVRLAEGSAPRSTEGAAASLTVERAAEAARLAGPRPEIASGTVLVPSGLSRGVVLIAEDEPRLAAAIAELLASDDYTIVVALDGIAALDLVAKHQPQLLITDVDMPGMTGIELASKFREITRDRVAPIIILSAMIDLGTRIAGLEAGAIDYISKPFAPPELRARVAAQFRMRDLVMRLHRAEQLASMGILTSGLAHELRNPANGIINAIAPLTELLPLAMTGPDTDAGQLLDAMKTSAEQIAFLVRQLLGFRAKGELELRPAEVGPLLQRAVALAKPALRGVELRVDLTVDKRVMCAAPLLVQVLANLVENAGHAAGRGGWVAIHDTSLGERIILEVTDSGPGVPTDLRERIFEPFFTTKDPGRGTGLGLSVARTILHRHGGILEVRERDGKTAFVVDLPGESILAAHADAV
jgi:signal transduction histidine kinase